MHETEPRWGDGPLESGGVPESETIRSLLLRAIHASAAEDDQAELEAWTTELSGRPVWRWASEFCLRRWAVARARLDGYVHLQHEMTAHVYGELVPRHGSVKQLTNPGGSVRCYRFEDETEVLFERSPVYANDGSGIEAWCYRQLDELPVGVDLLLVPDHNTAAERPPKLVETSAPETTSGAGIGRDPDPRGVTSTDSAGATAGAPPGDRAGSSPAPGGSGAASSGEDVVLQVRCTNTDCDVSYVVKAQHWPPPPGHECYKCGPGRGRLRAIPCGHADGATADDLQARPPTAEPWGCRDCRHDAVLHVGPREVLLGFRPDGSVAATNHPCVYPDCGCGAFLLPIPTSGSQCESCGHKVPWRVDGPGVINMCDACGRSGVLKLFDSTGEPVPEPRTETVEPPGPMGNPPRCEACGAQAEVRFKSQSKHSKVMVACLACAKKRKVSGGRRATTAIQGGSE